MCKEKRSLKERLIGSMNHHKKPRLIIFSAVLLGAIIFGTVCLAGLGIGKDTLPKISFCTRRNLDKLQDALMGKNIYAAPDYTDQEVAAARAVVEEYFRAVNAKDTEAILKTLTLQYDNPKVILYGEETRTLLSVDYNPEDPMRQRYITNGSLNGAKKEDVIVFKVNFNVHYPNGVTGPFNEGNYNNWSMILIRDDKASPWLIHDQGY